MVLGSNAYDPDSSLESEEEPQNMEDQQAQQQSNHHKPRLSNELRHLIFQEMLSLKTSDSLPHGSFKRIAKKYGYHHRTIRNLWKRAMQTKEANKPYIVDSKYKNCRRKRVVVPPNIYESKPMGNRTCIRDAVRCLDLAPSMVWRLIKRGEIKTHSNPLHSALTDSNKIRRVGWILSLIQEDTIQRHPIYKARYDFIHIDEKLVLFHQKTQSLSCTQRKDPL